MYIRGQIISYKARQNKLKSGELEKIEGELKLADQIYMNTSLQSDYNHILNLQYKYNSVLSEQVCKLLKLKQIFWTWW